MSGIYLVIIASANQGLPSDGSPAARGSSLEREVLEDGVTFNKVC